MSHPTERPASVPLTPWYGDTEGGRLLLDLQGEGILNGKQVARILGLHAQQPNPDQVYAEVFMLKKKTVGQLRAARHGLRVQVLEGGGHAPAAYVQAASPVQPKIIDDASAPVPPVRKIRLSPRTERVSAISARLLTATDAHIEAVEAVLSLGPRPGPLR